MGINNFNRLNSYCAGILSLILCCLCSVTAQCQDNSVIILTGNSFCIIGKDTNNTTKINAKFVTMIDFEKNVFSISFNGGKTPKDDIVAINKNATTRIITLYTKEGDKILISESWFIIKAVNDPNTYLLPVDHKRLTVIGGEK